MILLDTNILIDIVTRDPIWSQWSRAELVKATISDHEVVINDVVYAEFSFRYTDERALDTALERMGVVLAPTPRAALFLAGRSFRRYRAAGGTRTGVLPDFFIGAHAETASASLLTRDPRRYRTYFPDVELITPGIH